MIDPDRRYGPCSGRVWGLVLNLAFNVLALYGLAGVLRGSTHVAHLLVGLAGSMICVLWLARPSR